MREDILLKSVNVQSNLWFLVICIARTDNTDIEAEKGFRSVQQWLLSKTPKPSSGSSSAGDTKRRKQTSPKLPLPCDLGYFFLSFEIHHTSVETAHDMQMWFRALNELFLFPLWKVDEDLHDTVQYHIGTIAPQWFPQVIHLVADIEKYLRVYPQQVSFMAEVSTCITRIIHIDAFGKKPEYSQFWVKLLFSQKRDSCMVDSCASIIEHLCKSPLVVKHLLAMDSLVDMFFEILQFQTMMPCAIIAICKTVDCMIDNCNDFRQIFIQHHRFVKFMSNLLKRFNNQDTPKVVFDIVATFRRLVCLWNNTDDTPKKPRKKVQPCVVDYENIDETIADLRSILTTILLNPNWLKEAQVIHSIVQFLHGLIDRAIRRGVQWLSHVPDIDTAIDNILKHYQKVHNDLILNTHQESSTNSRKRKFTSTAYLFDAEIAPEMIEGIVQIGSELNKWLHAYCKRALFDMLTDEGSDIPGEELFPHTFICPITLKIMEDPVKLSDGHTYEREAITRWLQDHNRSPKTNQQLANRNMVPNQALKRMIDEYVEKKRNEYLGIVDTEGNANKRQKTRKEAKRKSS